MVQSLADKVLEASTQQTRLQRTINENEYALAAQEQSFHHVKNLRQAQSKQRAELDKLRLVVVAEHETHKKFRDSHVKKLAYRVGGKKERFEERASKEEQDWLNAVQAELRAKQALENIDAQLADAERSHQKISQAASNRNKARAQLEKLYSSLFEGPTPEYPEEDAKEMQVHDALRNHDLAQVTVSAEEQATQLLLQADRELQLAWANVQEAIRHNQLNTWGVGGSWNGMAEQSDLHQAQSHVQQVHSLVQQVQQLKPEIGNIVGPISVTQMNFLHVAINNPYMDMQRGDCIMLTQDQLCRGQASLRAEIERAHSRVQQEQYTLKERRLTLESRRNELFHIRADVFARISQGLDGNGEAPPRYDAQPPEYVAT